MGKGIKIICLTGNLSIAQRAWLVAQAERVFFAASATTAFASPAERAEFRQRWFGRYCSTHAASFLLALGADGAVAGYLAGALADPGREPAFADLDYDAGFAAVSRRFPAHLHVNIDADRRNLGIGAALIEAFLSQVAAAGLPGAHLVTNAASRNVAFYLRNGFAEQARAERPSKVLVLLARSV